MSRRRRPRRLTPDDVAVWEQVARTADPLGARHPGKIEPPARPKRSATPAPQAVWSAPKPVQPSTLPRLFGGRSDGPSNSVSMATAIGPVGRPEAGIDRRKAERLRRGDVAPDARIDLHGMTQDRAHRVLNGFLGTSLARGHRVVLVITGKGRTRRDDRDDAGFMSPSSGVLRDALPRWIKTGPYARRLVGIYEAHPRHGGSGAFYVYLKKARGT